jgi:hypothetical protein
MRTVEEIEANGDRFTRRITDKRISMLRSLKAVNEPQGAAAAVKQTSGGSGLDELKGVICTRQSRATCFKIILKMISDAFCLQATRPAILSLSLSLSLCALFHDLYPADLTSRT